MKAKSIARVFKAISNTSFAKKNTEDPEEFNEVSIFANNGEMRVVSTNSKIQVAYTIPGCDGIFSYVADNKTLASSIEAAADANGDVKFVQNEKGLMIVGSAVFPIPAGTPKQTQFAPIPEAPAASVLASDLYKAIKAVLLSAKRGNDTMKNVKWLFDSEKVQFKMVGFNGTMMTVANIPLEDMDEENTVPYILIDSETLNAIMPLIDCVKDEIVNVSIKDGRIMLSTDAMQILFSYFVDSFIECEKLLDSDFSKFITFNVKSLKKQVNAIYKMVKNDIQCASNGTIAAFKSGDFKMEATFEKANDVYFDISVTDLKNTLGCITDETVTISVFNKALIKIASGDSEDIVFVTGSVKK